MAFSFTIGDPIRSLVRRGKAPCRSAIIQLRDRLRGETAETYFDLDNLAEVNAELATYGIAPISKLPALGIVESEPVKRVLEVREDLRTLYPFALTPRQRRQFLAWLLAHGRRDLGITCAGALSYLAELDSTPDRGLIPSYLMNPEWQAAVPAALTPTGWPRFIHYLQEKYAIRSRWLARARWRRTDAAAPPIQRGVNVIGHYRYASGLQEACVGVAAALEKQGLPIAKRDLPVHFPCDWRDRERYQSLEIFGATIYVAAVNTFPSEYYRRSGLHMRKGVKRIALWYWEVDRLPLEWKEELTWADEVWAPTSFLADAYRKHVAVPVVPMLPGVALPMFERKPRSAFGLPCDRFLVLFSFDMGSVMERKNPLGLIEAYVRAFRHDDRVHLCIKVSRGDCDPKNLAQLKDACRCAGATLIDRVLPREDVLALFATADCYASLHRAEGFGLGMAESMLLGTPVLGTEYSGNLDFMTRTNSFLVDARLVPIENVPPYPPGSLWAEPDLDHAASLLRHIYEDREEAHEVARRGQREIAELLSVDAAGKRMIARLKETAE